MITFRVEGGQETAAALNGLPTRVSRSVLRDALLEGAAPMRRFIAGIAPRDPGAPDLADNIILAALRKRTGDDDVSVGIGVPKGFFYDWFLEWGTVNMGSQPFWRPGFDANVQSVIDISGKAIWRELAGRGIRRAAVIADTPVQSDGPLL